jgi:ribosomal-protein-alanine N-acetyltransferase
MGGIIARILDGKKEYEIVYSLMPKYWRNGYATETASTMKEFAFKKIDAPRFISIINVANIDSARVAKKNGMKVLFNSEYLGMNVHIFGISRTDISL